MMDKENDETAESPKKSGFKRRLAHEVSRTMVTGGTIVSLIGIGEIKSASKNVKEDNALAQQVSQNPNAQANGDMGVAAEMAHTITKAELDFHQSEGKLGLKEVAAGAGSVWAGGVVSLLNRKKKQEAEKSAEPQR